MPILALERQARDKRDTGQKKENRGIQDERSIEKSPKIPGGAGEGSWKTKEREGPLHDYP